MKRKSIIATALATLFSPALSFADGSAIVHDISDSTQVTLTPSFSTYIGADQTAEGDDGFEKINPALYYELALGVEGTITSKLIGSDVKLLFGASGKILDDSGLLLKLHEKDFTDGSTAKLDLKEAYIGIGSLLGNIKYGRLDTRNSIVDIFGLASVYGRFDGKLPSVIRYESPDINGATFTLSKSNIQRTKGYKNIDEKSSAEELLLDEKDEQKDFYAATVNYGLGDFSLQYAGSLTKDGIVGEDESAFFHRIEGTYTKGDLLVGLGYQYTKTNTGWGTEANWYSDIQTSSDGTLTVIEPEKYFEKKIFKTHEIIASTSYTIGKFVPKVMLLYGLKGEKAPEDDANQQAFPAYLQCTLGLDYNFSSQTAASFSFTKTNRIDEKDGAKFIDSKNFSFGINHTF
jgi:hypothetical protein